jgi:hypothetical protein
MSSGQDAIPGASRERRMWHLYRLAHQFAIPSGNGIPGDSNVAFFAEGHCHLMYLYRDESTHTPLLDHVSFSNLLH